MIESIKNNIHKYAEIKEKVLKILNYEKIQLKMLSFN